MPRQNFPDEMSLDKVSFNQLFLKRFIASAPANETLWCLGAVHFKFISESLEKTNFNLN